MDLVRKLSGASLAPTPEVLEMQIDFEVEEEQVLKGVLLIYSDKLNEAEEYFDTLRTGHARFSLHHAEVATFVALMSFDEDDLGFATSLLVETEKLAAEQEQKFRTHSNVKKVGETVSNMKLWALGKAAAALKKTGNESVAALGEKIMPKEEDLEAKMVSTREEMNRDHKIRRIRLWSLYVQSECFLIIALLNIVAAGESWSSTVKVGYNLKRAWTIYKHGTKKLQQLHQEWVAMGGSLQGELSGNLAFNYDSDDEDQEQKKDVTQVGSTTGSTSESSPRSSTEGWETRQRRASDPEMVELGALAASGHLKNLEGDIKEDQELASLRIGLECGIGSFNLIVSLIPSIYHKALELMGVPGDRAKGIVLLQKAATTHHVRSPLASLMLLQYHTVIMGLLPRTRNHVESAEILIESMAPTWKGGSIFRILQSRLARYEGRLHEATEIISTTPPNAGSPFDSNMRGCNLRLKNLMLEELGWCLMMQGEFAQAAQCFDALLKETVWFKPFYGCLKSACLWETCNDYHRMEAARILRDMTVLLGGKKEKFTPMEQYATRISNELINNGQAPLHPALELVAVYNGFQHMDRRTLERHLTHLQGDLQSRTARRAFDSIIIPVPEDIVRNVGDHPAAEPLSFNTLNLEGGQGSSNPHRASLPNPMSQVGQGSINLHRASQPNPMSQGERGSSSSPDIVTYKHTWTTTSQLTCRYLLALCLSNIGAKKPAEEHLRYVIANSEAPGGRTPLPDCPTGNVVPYSYYELGSLLLESDAPRQEGLVLLEECVAFPPHEFQARLKFVVGEYLRRRH